MNIETLIVINKCLRRTKIPLVRHLKTMFVTTTWKTVKFAPQHEPLDKKKFISEISPLTLHLLSYY